MLDKSEKLFNGKLLSLVVTYFENKFYSITSPIKLFTVVNNATNFVSNFVTAGHFHPSPIFMSKFGAYQSGATHSFTLSVRPGKPY
jgi:hypothetical protein